MTGEYQITLLVCFQTLETFKFAVKDNNGLYSILPIKLDDLRVGGTQSAMDEDGLGGDGIGFADPDLRRNSIDILCIIDLRQSLDKFQDIDQPPILAFQ